MPGGDRTGPLGDGPMTGRQLGYGAGFRSPGFMQNSGFSRGRGRINNTRDGYRNRDLNRNNNILSNGIELSKLKNEISFLKKSLSSINEKLGKLTENTSK